jgi:hypothetical protein
MIKGISKGFRTLTPSIYAVFALELFADFPKIAKMALSQGGFSGNCENPGCENPFLGRWTVRP